MKSQIPTLEKTADLVEFASSSDPAPATSADLLCRIVDHLSLDADSDGNAPWHNHKKPGIWDGTRGSTGAPCLWCALWAEAKRVRKNLAAVAQAEQVGVVDYEESTHVRWKEGMDRTTLPQGTRLFRHTVTGVHQECLQVALPSVQAAVQSTESDASST